MKRPRKKMSTGKLVILIVVILLLVGGGIAAAIILTSGGGGSGTYKLGSGTVVGANIKFRNVTLKQSGNILTLSGVYDNKSKQKGTVFVTVEATGQNTVQPINFSVPVTTASGKSFSQKQSSSTKLSGATLGTLLFESSSDSGNSLPFDTSPSDTEPQETTPNSSSFPQFTVPSSPYPSPSFPQGSTTPF